MPPPAPPAGPIDAIPAPTRRRSLVIGAGLAVAALAAVGIYLGTRDDSSTTAPMTTDVSSTIAPTAAPTTAPPTTATATTIDVTTTTPETVATTVPTPPPGFVDAGEGVFYDPAGWTTDDSDPPTLTSPDGTQSAFVEVHSRNPDEPPADLFAEYIATFDGDIAAVHYTAGFEVPNTTQAGAPVTIHRMAYRTYADDGTTLSGALVSIVRDDGLSTIVDSWTTADQIDTASIQPVIDSVFAGMRAVAVGHEVPATPTPRFDAVSAHAHSKVSDFVAVTPPPGWAVAAPPDGGGVTVARTDCSVTTFDLGEHTAIAEGTDAAVARMSNDRTLFASPPTVQVLDPTATAYLTTQVVVLTGTAPDGSPRTVQAVVALGDNAGNAAASYTTCDPADPEVMFIRRSITDDLLEWPDPVA